MLKTWANGVRPTVIGSSLQRTQVCNKKVFYIYDFINQMLSFKRSTHSIDFPGGLHDE